MKKHYIILIYVISFFSCQKERNAWNSGNNNRSQVDIYVAELKSNGVHEVATYWKNGNLVSLTDGSRNAKILSIAVSDNDTYACGYEE